MSVSLALMLMAAPDLGAAAPAFMAYDSVCAKADTVETIGARAVAEGWSDFEPERTSPMGYVVGVTRAIAGRSGDRVFRRDGDNLFIWVRETIPAPVGQFVECKIFDFSVAALPSEEAMAGWIGQPPAQKLNLADGQLRIWSFGGDKTTSVSIQTPPCFTASGCQKPRLVVERSILKP